jgi:hypothetical protein
MVMKLTGIRIFEGEAPRWRHHVRSRGTKMATMGVLLKKAERRRMAGVKQRRS